jgi:hypothetical protein
MNRMKQIFLYFCLALTLSNCAGTTQGWINQHEWLHARTPKGDIGDDLIFIPNEPNAASRQAYREQGWTWMSGKPLIY